MISEDRKRKLSRTREHCIETPQKKHRKIESDEESAEDGSQSLGENLFGGLFTWLCDVTSRNYFVKSAMSALKFANRQNGRSTARLSSNSQMQPEEEEEENGEISYVPRYDLKRTPLRERYKKSQQYVTLDNPIINQKKGSLHVRNMVTKAPKRSSNVLLEKRKVIENPFHASQKFRKADVQHINNFSSGKKMENSLNNFESSLQANKMTNSSVMNYDTAAPSSSANNSLKSENELSATPKAHAVGNFLYKKQGRTSDEVFALHEKDQYKLLLEHFTRCTIRQTPGQKSPTCENKEVQTSLCGKLPPESPMQQAFKKKTLDSSATVFLAKYFKGHSYGVTPKFASTNKSIATPPKKPENEDDVIIAEVKLPESRPFQTLHSLQPSPFFSPEWINELKKSFDEETEIKVKVIRDQEEKIKQYRESRAARLAAAEKAKEQNRVILSEAEVEDTSIEFPELTPKMEEIIDDALNPEPPEEVLCVGFNISVSRKDIETLAGLNWLNDEIIYFYINLLVERSKNDSYPSVYAFNTFFYPKLLSGGHSALKRWTRRIDIFSFDLILVPVHMGMHWCLAVIDFRHKKIRYYDSMGGQNTDCLHALRDYLKDERMDKKKEKYDMTGWVYENIKNIPHQMNGSDCGMFTLKYAEYITRDAKITFTQDHMQYFRRRMVYEILTKQLL